MGSGLVLGPPSPPHHNLIAGNTPPFIQAIQQNLTDAPIFSLYLRTSANHTISPAGGVITLGAVDKENCHGVIDWIPLSEVGQFKFNLSAVNVGDAWKRTKESTAISESSAATIVGPKNSVKGLAKAVNITYDDDYNMYTVACNATYTPVSFHINSHHYNVTSAVLNIDIGLDGGSGETCMWGIQPDDGEQGNTWVLGTPFMRQFCHSHDMNQTTLGLAKPRR